MKNHILPAVRLTTLCLVLLTVIYPAIVWGIAQFTPGSGNGIVINERGNRYYSNIGQKFNEDGYFWSRPSAVDYNAAGSGGSNMGPSNPEYLQTVKARIDTFLVHNPEVDKSEIPVELVTASGSGLDPHISVRAARVQVKRIAGTRGLSEAGLNVLINRYTERPLFGILGPEKVNVVKMNYALDQSMQRPESK